MDILWSTDPIDAAAKAQSTTFLISLVVYAVSQFGMYIEKCICYNAVEIQISCSSAFTALKYQYNIQYVQW